MVIVGPGMVSVVVEVVVEVVVMVTVVGQGVPAGE